MPCIVLAVQLGPHASVNPRPAYCSPAQYSVSLGSRVVRRLCSVKRLGLQRRCASIVKATTQASQATRTRMAASFHIITNILGFAGCQHRWMVCCQCRAIAGSAISSWRFWHHRSPPEQTAVRRESTLCAACMNARRRRAKKHTPEPAT